MASIKIKFKPSTIENREGTVYYQIIHERRVRQLFTRYHIFEPEWDSERSAVIIGTDISRSMFIRSVRERIRWDMERLAMIVRRLEDCAIPYTSDDIITEFQQYAEEYSLFNYMEAVMLKLRHNGRVRTAETYRSTLSSFKKFREYEDIMLHELSSELMESYEGWLYNIGVSANTVSFYMRVLRAVYNRAVDDGKIENRRPFRHVYTGIGKTVKRALPLAVIRQIKELDLMLMPALDFARDMFVLSFMLRGMSFVDMAYLKKSDLVNGCLTYRRRKTGQLLLIEWTNEMQQILDKYPPNKSDYLLPIIKGCEGDARIIYRNAGSRVNYALKHIARMVGVKIPLTLYVARHSWASAARTKGVPVGVISEGMGHNSESTTQIYLASLDMSEVNKANKLILASL